MQDIDYLKDFLVRYFNISMEDLYSNSKKGNHVLARFLLWYLLHYEFGVSSYVLAQEYKKSRRNIMIALSKFRNGITTQKYYRDIYENFKKEFEKEKAVDDLPTA